MGDERGAARARAPESAPKKGRLARAIAAAGKLWRSYPRADFVRGQWRHEVEVRVVELEGRLAKAEAGGGTVSREEEALARAVKRALREARRAIVPECCFPRRIQHWWTGAALTHAWESVHLAEAGVIAISSQQVQAEMVPRLRAWLELVLPNARALHRYEAEFDRWTAGTAKEGVLREAYQAAIAANIEWHTNLRAFRNMLLCVAAGLLVLLVALAACHAVGRSILHLGAPGRSLPVSLVELVGAFGGLLSSTFLLAKLEKPPARYNVLAPQIVLKAVAGAASALVGLMFLQSGLVLEPPQAPSEAVVLTYAVLFGYSQQAITQMIDRHSTALLSPGGTARPG
jgi:hypothetical protein